MSRKLNVEELESRIAPSMGLADFLKTLSANDAAKLSQFLNPDGSINTGAVTSAWNAAGGSQVNALRGSYPVSNGTVLSDKAIQQILSFLSKR